MGFLERRQPLDRTALVSVDLEISLPTKRIYRCGFSQSLSSLAILTMGSFQEFLKAYRPDISTATFAVDIVETGSNSQNRSNAGGEAVRP